MVVERTRYNYRRAHPVQPSSVVTNQCTSSTWIFLQPRRRLGWHFLFTSRSLGRRKKKGDRSRTVDWTFTVSMNRGEKREHKNYCDTLIFSKNRIRHCYSRNYRFDIISIVAMKLSSDNYSSLLYLLLFLCYIIRQRSWSRFVVKFDHQIKGVGVFARS